MATEATNAQPKSINPSLQDLPDPKSVKKKHKLQSKKKVKNKKSQDQINKASLSALKKKIKQQKALTAINSKKIMHGAIISSVNYKPNPEKYIIELKDVRKSYVTGDLETQVLRGVDLKLEHSDFVAILGPSGSGKTTLLNLISGLDKATEGDVFNIGHNLSLLRDVALTRFRRNYVGFIFQQYNLLSNLTAKENAEVGANLARKKNNALDIKTIFEMIGMKSELNKYPHQMSGGQQQRVSIARALSKNPQILFGDEPTGALDEKMGRTILEILLEINQKYKTTVILVTHNPNIAEVAKTVIHIQNGKILEFYQNKNPKKPSEVN